MRWSSTLFRFYVTNDWWFSILIQIVIKALILHFSTEKSTAEKQKRWRAKENTHLQTSSWLLSVINSTNKHLYIIRFTVRLRLRFWFCTATLSLDYQSNQLCPIDLFTLQWVFKFRFIIFLELQSDFSMEFLYKCPKMTWTQFKIFSWTNSNWEKFIFCEIVSISISFSKNDS